MISVQDLYEMKSWDSYTKKQIDASKDPRWAKQIINKYKHFDKVLDIGCGIGIDLNYMAKYIKSGIGVDINEMAIIHANKVNCPDNIKYIYGDWSKIKFDHKFDLISASRSIFSDYDNAFKRVTQLLSNDGLFYAVFVLLKPEEELIVKAINKHFKIIHRTDAYKEDTGWKYSELIFELKSK